MQPPIIQDSIEQYIADPTSESPLHGMSCMRTYKPANKTLFSPRYNPRASIRGFLPLPSPPGEEDPIAPPAWQIPKCPTIAHGVLVLNPLFACYDPGLRGIWLPVLLVANAVFIFNQHAEICRMQVDFEEIWMPPPPHPPVAVMPRTVKEKRVREEKMEGPPSWLIEERSMPYWQAVELEERRREEHEERMTNYGPYFS